MYSTLSPSWEKHVLLALVSATFATAAPQQRLAHKVFKDSGSCRVLTIAPLKA